MNGLDSRDFAVCLSPQKKIKKIVYTDVYMYVYMRSRTGATSRRGRSLWRSPPSTSTAIIVTTVLVLLLVVAVVVVVVVAVLVAKS